MSSFSFLIPPLTTPPRHCDNPTIRYTDRVREDDLG
jgi:hypothetical protein